FALECIPQVRSPVTHSSVDDFLEGWRNLPLNPRLLCSLKGQRATPRTAIDKSLAALPGVISDPERAGKPLGIRALG
ncbi:MAG: hypothetical protein ACO21O_10295, partial [Steroidobacteraceae bacterium]